SVPAGMMFYVPFAFADDTPPILGTFPTSPGTAPFYWFALSQLGGSDSITVDGQTTSIGAAYLAGPLRATLDDHPTEHVGHIITLGVFLTPLSRGTHTVKILPNFDGALLAQDLGFDFLHGEFTYNVTIQ